LEPHYPPGWLSGLGRNYYLAKRYAEAEAAQKDALELIRKGGSYSPKWPHLILSAVYIETGHEEQARAHMQKVLEIDPKFNIEDRGKQSLFKDPEMNERELEAHRKAGAPERPPLKLPDKPSFAVLPFTNMSGDPEQEYLSDGFTDTIIGALSKLPNVFVIARTSSFYYKGKSVTVKQVARELGVQYVIEGSVQRSGDKLRVTVQMIDASTGGHVWSERYDRNMKDIFEIQDEITLQLVNSIKDKYNIRYVYPVVSATKNLEAYLKSIKAQYLFWDKTSRANLEKARELLEEAIALDPNYLFPYTWLPYVHQFEARRGYSKSPEKSLELGLKIAKKALEMDETSSEALSALGYMYYNTKQYDKAIEIYKKAIDLGPNSPNSYDIGYALIYSGRPEEAIPYFKKGERVSPKHFINSFRFGLAYLCMGKYEEAIPYYQEALKRLPGFDRLHVDLAACYAAAGRIEEAKVEVQYILEAIPNFSVEFYIKKLPARSPEDIKLFAEALRKIPIPE
jgi:adenylate cyclase